MLAYALTSGRWNLPVAALFQRVEAEQEVHPLALGNARSMSETVIDWRPVALQLRTRRNLPSLRDLGSSQARGRRWLESISIKSVAVVLARLAYRQDSGWFPMDV